LEAGGSKLVKPISELELGFAESLGNRFGGEEPSDALSFELVKRLKSVEEFGGQLFLLGSQGNVVHESPHAGEYRANQCPGVRVIKIAPTFELLTR
jgi:hypothetical protein